jgi:hypothetical protein
LELKRDRKSGMAFRMEAAAAPVAFALGSNPVGWVVGGALVAGAGIMMAKERSQHPPAKRDRSNTRKEAEEKARRAGNGRPPRGPEDHGHGPHFHPDTDKPGKKHDHYYFPKRFF